MNETPEQAAPESAVHEITVLMFGIARALVDNPKSVSLVAIPDGESTILRLRVAPGDVGKVIGKQGRTARSMRTILSAASRKFNVRFALDILEEGESESDS